MVPFERGRPELVVGTLSEEHGIIDVSGSDWRPELGDRVRIARAADRVMGSMEGAEIPAEDDIPF